MYLFCLSSLHDTPHQHALRQHLAPSLAERCIDYGDLSSIGAGSVTQAALQEHCARADWVLFLLSAAALNDQALLGLARAARQRQALVPILVSDAYLPDEWRALQILPPEAHRTGAALSDSTWVTIVRSIVDMLPDAAVARYRTTFHRPPTFFHPLRAHSRLELRNPTLGEILDDQAVLGLDAPLWLCGAPGAGKSAWSAWLFQQCLRRADCLPFLLHLDHAQPAGGPAATNESLEEWLDRQNCYFDPRCAGLASRAFREPGRYPRLLLIFDAWDQRHFLRQDLTEQIASLQGRCPRALVIMTSRPGWPPPEDWTQRFLQPLSDADIFSFIQARSPTLNPAELLRSHGGAARRLLRNPRHLSWLVDAHGAPLRGRCALYHRSVDRLLSAPARDAAEWTPDNPHQCRECLAELAYGVQMQAHPPHPGTGSTVLVSRTQWRDLLPQLSPQAKEGFLHWLCHSAGICQRQEHSFSFVEPALQEYLAAEYLALSHPDPADKHKAFLALARDDAWWETLLLLAEMTADIAAMGKDHPVFTGLCAMGGTGLCILGMLLADGLGQDATFAAWLPAFQRWAQGALEDPYLSRCLARWAGSHDKERREHVLNLPDTFDCLIAPV